jgi:branched-chain amino acid transport system permease protein
VDTPVDPADNLSTSAQRNDPSLGIGTDEWVARHGERLTAKTGLGGYLQSGFDRIPGTARWLVALLIAIAVPLQTNNGYIMRVGVNLGLFIVLAYGLNIVVGYAGLLDLGYAAFYGFGAYGYALLSSEQLGHHWPTYITVPVVVIATALLGFLVSLPSRRLMGDYLAIVTLFFGQVFIQVVLSSDSITFPWATDSVDITGGSNGIPGLDPFVLFGHKFLQAKDYYWLLLAIIIILTLTITRVNRTRIGRAWRSIREDSLAAQAMGISVNRLKFLAFVVGAALAGLAGTILSAVQGAVFINGFDLPLLTLVYAAVILGGSGSLPGAVMGATVMSLLPEILRVPRYSEILFFAALVLVIGAMRRTLVRFFSTIAGIVVTGFIVHGLFAALSIKGLPEKVWASGELGRVLGHWLFVPENRLLWGNTAFVLLIALIAYMTQATPRVKQVLLPIVAFLGIFLWEVRLIQEPSVTRQLIIGSMLIVLMVTRPQGFLGRARVEVL